MIHRSIIERNDRLKIHYEDGAILACNPPESLFGYTYHAHMIPPFDPQRILILGYGDGQVAYLIHKIWPSKKAIVGVDIKPYECGQDDILVIENALSFVEKTTSEYDYIVVDLWQGSKVCEFIYNAVFARKLFSICTGLLCIDLPKAHCFVLTDKGMIYAEVGFRYDRHDTIGENAVMFWRKEDKNIN